MTVTTELEPGAAAADRRSSSPTAGRASARCPRCATRSTPRWRAAKRTGWDGLLRGPARATSTTSGRAPTWRSTATPPLQQAVRFALFQVLQAAAARRAAARSRAKGLTGRGYDGHAFWDMETYTLPVLTYTAPEAARDALRWRHSTLDLAKDRARGAGLRRRGVPVAHDPRARSARATGPPAPPASTSTPTSPTRCGATSRRRATRTFEREIGLELLVETARLWRSLGHHDAAGNFRIDGVTGPDEYSALADNNVYTNLMAARNLRCGRGARRPPPRTMPPSSASTRRRSPTGATRRTRWWSPTTTSSASRRSPRASPATATGTSRARRPSTTRCCSTIPYYELYSQPGGQAGRPRPRALPLRRPLHRRAEGCATSPTTSASPCATPRCRPASQAIVAAEVGHLELAYDYLRETALIDLRNLADNTARRPAPRVPGRDLAGRGRRLRRPARPRRHAALLPAAAVAPHPAALPARLPRPAPARRRRP